MPLCSAYGSTPFNAYVSIYTVNQRSREKTGPTIGRNHLKLAAFNVDKWHFQVWLAIYPTQYQQNVKALMVDFRALFCDPDNFTWTTWWWVLYFLPHLHIRTDHTRGIVDCIVLFRSVNISPKYHWCWRYLFNACLYQLSNMKYFHQWIATKGDPESWKCKCCF